MKTLNLMMTAPVLAMLATAPAHAQPYNGNSPADNTTANTSASVTAPTINLQAVPPSVDKRMTAEGMIGKPVYNEQNKRIATVEDIILDKDGAASLVVVKEHNFLNLGGKLAAFDYSAITDRKADGDVIMPITEKTVSNAAEFSYKASDKTGIRVIPESGYSLKNVLKGNLVDASGNKLAAIDNVALHNGKATLLMISYNQVMDLGGDKAALDFDATSPIVRDKDHVNLMLGSADTQKFQDFAKANK